MTDPWMATAFWMWVLGAASHAFWWGVMSRIHSGGVRWVALAVLSAAWPVSSVCIAAVAYMQWASRGD